MDALFVEKQKTGDNMKKAISIILIILAVSLMIVNFAFAIKYLGEDGANLFTTISGWVSGIATIVLGVIALCVNEQYKKENDNYLSKQDELAWKSEKRAAIELYREQVVRCYQNFIEYNFADLLYQLLINHEKIEAPIYDVALINKIRAEKHNLVFNLTICKYYFSLKSELFDAHSRYLNLLFEMIDDYEKMIFDKECKKAEELQKTYVEVINLFNLHISHINAFLSTTLYSKNKNELKTILDDMRQKQLDWWEVVKPQENNNHRSE